MAQSIAIQITDPTRAGEARRAAVLLAQEFGFDETQTGKISIVATELGTNLAKYAREGLLLMRPLEERGVRGLELLSLDKGPGMANVAECMRDGYSTSGSRGTGLGAIQRLSEFFDIFSLPGTGTAIVAQFWAGPTGATRFPLEFGAVNLAMPGETSCGDGWCAQHFPGRSLVLVADGLGHGPLASRAAEEAARVFREFGHHSPADIIRAAHGPLRHTRGAVIAIAEFRFAENAVRYSGVGNIAAAISCAASWRSLVSHNGTVGHELQRVHEYMYPWTPESLLIMHTDGLNTRWHLDAYPGLRMRHPALIAGILYRDFQRGHDDATVLVGRQSNP